MHLELLAGGYAIARLPAGAPIPEWAQEGEFVSITRTPDELSIVCAQAPIGVQCQRDWRCFKVRGPLEFSLTGVLASLAAPLAEAGISILAISTFDTDYVLVPGIHVDEARAVLIRAGHPVTLFERF
jgi:hypothetical protein